MNPINTNENLVTPSATKYSSNLWTVTKRTIINSFSQPSTWIIQIVMIGVITLFLIILPLALKSSLSDYAENFVPQYMSSMFYPVTMCTVVAITTVTVNSLDLNETTFVLSRPVNRTSYTIGKILASMVTGSVMLVFVLLLYLINYFVMKTAYNVNVFTELKTPWITYFLPTILAWLFAIMSCVFFRCIFKKDSVIALIGILITLATYLLYNIISTIVTKDEVNVTIAYLIIPSVVFSTLSIAFGIGGFMVFKNMVVRV